MRTIILLFIALSLAVALASCVSHPVVLDRADGSTVAYLGGSLGAKVGPRIADITTRNGTRIKYASRSEDGTEVPKYLANMYAAAKLAETTANVTKHADSLKSKEVLGAQEVQKNKDTLNAQGKATSEGLAAGAEPVVSPITPPGS